MINEDAKQQHNAPCGNCGGTEFEWGSLRAGELLFFEASKTPVLQRMANLLGLARYAVRTRRCLSCGNLQLFARN